jgi:integrase
VKALTEDELRLPLDKLPNAWRPFFEFLAQTGLRIGEAIELRWRAVDGQWLDVRRRFSRGNVGKPKGVGTPANSHLPRTAESALTHSWVPGSNPGVGLSPLAPF